MSLPEVRFTVTTVLTQNGETPQAAAERILKACSNSKPVKNIFEMLSNPVSFCFCYFLTIP